MPGMAGVHQVPSSPSLHLSSVHFPSITGMRAKVPGHSEWTVVPFLPSCCYRERGERGRVGERGREGERGRKGEGGRESERESEREGGRVRKSEREGERVKGRERECLMQGNI